MYLLLPLQIFKLRKKMYDISTSNLSFENKKNKMIDVYNELKIIIEDTLKAIDLSYNSSKINIKNEVKIYAIHKFKINSKTFRSRQG